MAQRWNMFTRMARRAFGVLEVAAVGTALRGENHVACLGKQSNGRGEFGINGTAWPHWFQIRAAVSLGCVRMLNSHIRQLFDAVDV